MVVVCFSSVLSSNSSFAVTIGGVRKYDRVSEGLFVSMWWARPFKKDLITVSFLLVVLLFKGKRQRESIHKECNFYRAPW